MSTDIVEIEQLLYAYCHAVDRGTPTDVAALFHQEATLVPTYEGEATYQGREAILGWYTRYGQATGGAVTNLRHKISCPWVRVDGSNATAVCYLDADSVSKDQGNVQLSQGRYEDKLVKHDGRWLFMERAIIVTGSVALPRS